MSRKFIPFALGGLEKKSIGYSRMVPFPLVNLHVTKEELKAFGDIYFDVVDGFAERDFDYFK